MLTISIDFSLRNYLQILFGVSATIRKISLLFLAALLFSSPALGSEECPHLEKIKGLTLDNIAEQIEPREILNSLDFSESKEAAHCLILLGWSLGEKLYPANETYRDVNNRLEILQQWIQQKIFLQREFEKARGREEQKIGDQLAATVAILSNINLHWGWAYQETWAFDEKVSKHIWVIGTISAITAGLGLVFKPAQKILKKTFPKLSRNQRIQGMFRKLIARSKSMVTKAKSLVFRQGPRAGVRGAGGDQATDEAESSALDQATQVAPAPPFQEIADSEKYQYLLDPDFQIKPTSKSFDFLVQDIAGEVLPLTIGILSGYFSENAMEKAFRNQVAHMIRKNRAKGPQGKRLGARGKKAMEFAKKRGKLWGKIGAFAGATVVAIGGTFVSKLAWDFYIEEKRIEEYEEYGDYAFAENVLLPKPQEEQTSPRDRSLAPKQRTVDWVIEKYNQSKIEYFSKERNFADQHSEIQTFITLFKELVHQRIYNLTTLEDSMTGSLVKAEGNRLHCVGHEKGEYISPDDALEVVMVGKAAKGLDDQFAENFQLVTDDFHWIMTEITNIRDRIENRENLSTKELFLLQLKMIETEVDELTDPERTIGNALTKSAAIISQRADSDRKYFCR